MNILEEKLAEIVPKWRDRVRKLIKDGGDVKVGEVTVGQVYGGMRDVRSLVTDISYVDPNEGIRLRGFTIPELLVKLPKAQNSRMPYAGGIYYLLVVGELPTEAQALAVEDEWRARSVLPGYVYDVLRAMPADSHPMTMFSTGLLAMQREARFARVYHDVKREDYWRPMLEDSLDLTARAPAVAAYIYTLHYKGGVKIDPDPDLDWGANLACMMGYCHPEYQELSRLYMLAHCDHESGNVSAHTTHLVGSALSDIYYATSAGMNGLAGPLHGLANQESLIWLLGVMKRFGSLVTREQLEGYVWEMLNGGHVIPGYGHGVLRITDPRFTMLHDFGKHYMPDDDLFKLVDMVYEVVPEVLMSQGKAKDPWPNLDAISGALQYHYGVTEFDFYTVLFGVGRLLGISANAIWARALGQPLERPKSLTTKMLEDAVAKATAG